MNASWTIPFIIVGGALQSCGAAMNGQLNKSVPIRGLPRRYLLRLSLSSSPELSLSCRILLPMSKDLASMPWWAVIGGLVGAVQVYAGLTLVTKVGAGPFVGLTVTAALVMSLMIDHFGWFRMEFHPLNIWRVLGALLLVAGVTLIAKF